MGGIEPEGAAGPVGEGGTLAVPEAGTIEIRLARVSQLFNMLDPFPFRERDLDRNAEAFIVDWPRGSGSVRRAVAGRGVRRAAGSRRCGPRCRR